MLRKRLSGRTAYLQTLVLPIKDIRLLGRVSYFVDGYGTETGQPPLHELGVVGSAAFRLTAWLSLRASLLLRVALSSVLGPGVSGDRVGAVARTSLTGHL